MENVDGIFVLLALLAASYLPIMLVVSYLPIALFGYLVYLTTRLIFTPSADANIPHGKLFKRFIAAVGANLLAFAIFAFIIDTLSVLYAASAFVYICIIPLAVFLYLVVSMGKLASEEPEDEKKHKKSMKGLMICTIVDSLLFLPFIAFLWVKI